MFVPSYRDVHHEPVYPQPPYNVGKDEKVHFVSDPSVINVGGVVIGLTSTDILLHLGTEEICYPPGTLNKEFNIF